MVNDRVMGQAQLPVIVDGKTYYGCCAGCVGRLNEDRKVRVSTDPVTGRDIDKSEAVILQGESGEALYFESEDTARRYRGREAGKESFMSRERTIKPADGVMAAPLHES